MSIYFLNIQTEMTIRKMLFLVFKTNKFL